MKRMEDRINFERQGRAAAEVKELHLDNSRFNRIEGLTSVYTSLKILSMNNVGLTSLKGFPALPQLTRLELSLNRLSGGFDVLRGCPKLTHINLGGNQVKNLEALEPMKNLTCLSSLNLIDNPLSKEIGYCERVAACLPRLSTLDMVAIEHLEEMTLVVRAKHSYFILDDANEFEQQGVQVTKERGQDRQEVFLRIAGPGNAVTKVYEELLKRSESVCVVPVSAPAWLQQHLHVDEVRKRAANLTTRTKFKLVPNGDVLLVVGLNVEVSLIVEEMVRELEASLGYFDMQAELYLHQRIRDYVATEAAKDIDEVDMEEDLLMRFVGPKEPTRQLMQKLFQMKEQWLAEDDASEEDDQDDPKKGPTEKKLSRCPKRSADRCKKCATPDCMKKDCTACMGKRSYDKTGRDTCKKACPNRGRCEYWPPVGPLNTTESNINSRRPIVVSLKRKTPSVDNNNSSSNNKRSKMPNVLSHKYGTRSSTKNVDNSDYFGAALESESVAGGNLEPEQEVVKETEDIPNAEQQSSLQQPGNSSSVVAEPEASASQSEDSSLVQPEVQIGDPMHLMHQMMIKQQEMLTQQQMTINLIVQQQQKQQEQMRLHQERVTEAQRLHQERVSAAAFHFMSLFGGAQPLPNAATSSSPITWGSQIPPAAAFAGPHMDPPPTPPPN